MVDLWQRWPRAWGAPPGKGCLRRLPEDFLVEELPATRPSGTGEHWWLRLRKRTLNTWEVAERLARLAGVPTEAVGFAGLKDRRAVTVQSFSVPVTGREPPWTRLEGAGIELLAVTRHSRKLRRGELTGNAFCIRIRDLQGDRKALEGRLARIAQRGVPNYFGPQRFGRRGDNLRRAQALFEGARAPSRALRGLWLSAARAWLFNEVLAERVRQGNWNRPLPGELLQLGSGVLQPALAPVGAAALVAQGRAHPTGPLWGRSGARPQPRGEAAALEQAVLAGQGPWCRGLEEAGLSRDRRALRLSVARLEHRFEGDDLILTFELPKGGYATALLRELIKTP